MGQSLNPLTTHEAVPEDVKGQIAPVDFTPCPEEQRQTDREECEDCGAVFGWFCASVNCEVCGRMLCRRCCPPRYLYHDSPACVACLQVAFRARRTQMLNSHYANAGLPVRQQQPPPPPTAGPRPVVVAAPPGEDATGTQG